ncbi:hypothetical protein BGZ46_002230 [Entomortierella lignicola]|nr:hypothetical protein BGZ46_002230 [Entomortierella lignicola]
MSLLDEKTYVVDRDTTRMANGPSPTTSSRSPHVLIAGAGIGGLMLANILEKTDIPYEIFEKSKEIKAIGAVLSLNPTVFPSFEQLGIYEELLRISYPVYHAIVRDKDAKLQATFGIENSTELEGVMVRLNDGTTVHGEILVGADGAYSGVRQHLYKQLSSVNKLPKSDTKPLRKGYICMVGLTNPLDSEKFPDLKDDFSHSHTMVNDTNSYSWGALTLPGNVISWGAILQLDGATFADEQFRNSEWGPEANEPLIKAVQDFMTPYGTLGSLIESSSKDNISRVFLEEKFFETWIYSRTALLGDACHKLIPSSGLGAVIAIQDAIILANCIYDIEVTSYDTIVSALKNYYEQRHKIVKSQYESSKLSAKILYGHTLMERAMRHVITHYMPASTQNLNLAKTMAYRPQIAFLPLIPNRGTGAVVPQKLSKKYLKKQDKNAAASKEAVAV